MLRPDYPLVTERLELRPLRLDDLDDLLLYHSRPDVTRYLYWEPRDRPRMLEALRQRMRMSSLTREGDRLVCGAVLRSTGTVIGEVNLAWLSEQHRQGEIGFVFNPGFQGRGLADRGGPGDARTRHSTTCRLHRIIGRCDARNAPSARLMERLGMRREAHFVHSEIFKGDMGRRVRLRDARPRVAGPGSRLSRVSAGTGRPGPIGSANIRTDTGLGGGGRVRVLGVDPGLTRCGVGVVEGVPGQSVHAWSPTTSSTPTPSDELPAPAAAPRSHASPTLVAQHRPDAVAVERVFSQHNVRTVMGTAQAGAVAVLAAARAGLPVQMYTPSEVKAAVTGSGQADKAQMTAMVTRLLRLDAPPRPADAADALALAICHVWRGGDPGQARRRRSRRQRGSAMIASVRGRVAAFSADSAVIEVGGVGLAVHCTPATLAGLRVGADARLATSLVVREDSLTLYGFADDDEKHLFELLQTASGVGPRLAQAVLAVLSPDVRAQGDRERRHRDADPGTGHRQEGRGAAGTRAARPDRARPAAVRAPATAGPGRARPRPGPSRYGRAWSGSAGRPSRPTRRVGRRSPSRSTARCRRYRSCCARPSGCSGAPDERAVGVGALADRRASGTPRPASAPAGWPSSSASTASASSSTCCCSSALRRGTPPDHILLSGSPGLGKTTLAMIVAAELGTGLRITSGPAIERSGDLAAVLTSLATGDVLFIDEIHRMAQPGRGAALQRDGGLPGRRDRRQGAGRDRHPAGRGAVHPGRRHHPGRPADRPDARPVRLRRRTSTSTTRPTSTRVLHRSARHPRGPADRRTARPRSPAGPAGHPASPTGCCGGCATTPRSGPTASSPATIARPRCTVYDVDELGLDRLDRAVLHALVRRFGGGPVGLSTLAVAVGEQPDTVEEVCEPFLVRAGLLARTPRGRVATAGAWRHLGLTPPDRIALSDRVGRPDTMGGGAASLPDLFSQEP